VEEFTPTWIADLEIDELSLHTMAMRFIKRVLPYAARVHLERFSRR
jgi:hypothetical protein